MVRDVRATPFGCQACYSASAGQRETGSCVDHRPGGKDQHDPQLGSVRQPEPLRLPDGALPCGGVPVEQSRTAAEEAGQMVPFHWPTMPAAIVIRPVPGGWGVAVGASEPVMCRTWGRVLIEVAKCGPVD